MNNQPIKLLHITSVPVTLDYFLTGQVGYMKARGLEVHVLSSPGEELDYFGNQEQIPVHTVEMLRRITPARDLIALVRLLQHVSRLRPQIVHAHTPKGGLLGMVGAWLTRVPVRVYHLRGLRHMTATGAKRRVLTWTERISCALAHRVICVSPSVRALTVEMGICAPDKITVFRHGSGNGVDAQIRFDPARLDDGARAKVREQHNIPLNALVVGFVGRIVRDKGVEELAEAWLGLREEYPGLHMLVAGRFEPQDPVSPDVRMLLESDPRIHLAGFQRDTTPLYAAMDIVALPTYREGFPNVPMEAAAMTLPVVATRVPGCVDAVQDGVTGLLVPPRDVPALVEALRQYLDDAELRLRHGQAGRERALRDFQPTAIWEAIYQEYARLLRARGIPVPDGGGDADLDVPSIPWEAK